MSKTASLQSLVGRTSEWIQDGAEAVQNTMEEASDRVVRGTRRARRRAGRLMRDAQDQLIAAGRSVDRWRESARDLVVEHPGKAILAASAAGFLVGVVVARRRR